MEEAYENHLIIKLVLFQFVNSFLSLFYIAFYLRDMGRLKEQLAALLITKQVIGNIKEAFLPWVVWKVKLLKTGYKINKKVNAVDKKADVSPPDCVEEEDTSNVVDPSLDTTSDLHSEFVASELQVERSTVGLTQAEVESAMKPYEDTFEDYLEMVIQFGYVTLFSPAFPMAAMCALLNNVIEIRSDAFKLCVTFQRPFGQRVESIGTWQDALELLGVIAVIVNCCLVGVFGHTKRLAPELDESCIFILIVILEHAILFLKFGVAYAIPDIPEGVAMQMARLEFLRREALKKLESKSQPTKTPPNSPLQPPNSPARGIVEDNSVTPSHASQQLGSRNGDSSPGGRPGYVSQGFRSSAHAKPSSGSPRYSRETTPQLLDGDVSSAISYLKTSSTSTSVANPSYRPHTSTSSHVTQRKVTHESYAAVVKENIPEPTHSPDSEFSKHQQQQQTLRSDL